MSTVSYCMLCNFSVGSMELFKVAGNIIESNNTWNM